jgi:hypothetical protein
MIVKLEISKFSRVGKWNDCKAKYDLPPDFFISKIEMQNIK